MSERQESDYLWDRSGAPDDEARHLEALLSPLAPPEPRVPVRRRSWLAPILVALLTFGFVFGALPDRAIPSRIAGIFHDDFPGEIGVRGGTRVEYEVVADAPDLPLSNQVAEGLRQRGANVVFVRPGSIIIDLVGVAPAGVTSWSRGIGAFGKLELTLVEADTELMRGIYAACADDPRAAELGISAEVDFWTHDPSGRRFSDYYLLGPDASTVGSYLAELMGRDASMRTPEGVEIAFETVQQPDGSKQGVRSYLVRDRAIVTQEDVANATVVYEPALARPEILVELTPDGGRRFADLTRANVGRKLAIRLDDAVQSAPVVMSAITGGRFSISMGTDGADAGEAEGLAAAFRHGTLAAPVALVSVTEVEPVLAGGAITAARALFALPFALFALLVALAIARFAPRIEPAVFALRGRERVDSDWWLRPLVTLAGAAAAALCTWVPLPAVDHDTVRSLGAEHAQFSVFALGLRPVLSAFILVEVVALLLPAWRRARVSGPGGRAKLGVATALLSLVLAGLQAWFLLTWMESFGWHPDGPALIAHDAFWPRATIFLSLVGGTVLLIVLASIINRRGLGNGYVVVLLGGMAHEAYQLVKGYLDGSLSATTLGWLVLFTVSTIAVTNTVLRLRVRGGASRLTLQLPTCGYVPLAWTAGLFALAGIAATVHLELPLAWLFRADGSMSAWIFLGTAVVLAVLCSLLFSLPIRFESVVTLVSPRPAPRFSSRVFWAATAVSAAIVISLAALYLLGTGKLPATAPDVLWLAMATAGIMDLVADARARLRNPRLTAVWPIHRVQLTDVAIEALANRGIDAHVQSLYFRKLFYFFAPYAPILVMVPEDRAEEAREALASMLAGPGQP